MFTEQRSAVAIAIRDYRKIRGLSQDKLAAEAGISGCYVSALEQLREDRITPAVYTAFQSIGLDLKIPVPSLLVLKLAGKSRTFKTKINEKVTRKDPIKLLTEAKQLVTEANSIINTKINAWDVDINQKEGEIKELHSLKKDLAEQRTKLLDEIIAV
jgi:transcriptional regulator with XRE-family HTH domain